MIVTVHADRICVSCSFGDLVLLVDEFGTYAEWFFDDDLDGEGWCAPIGIA